MPSEQYSAKPLAIPQSLGDPICGPDVWSDRGLVCCFPAMLSRQRAHNKPYVAVQGWQVLALERASLEALAFQHSG